MRLVQKLNLPNDDVKVYMVRLDKIHPSVNGNKYFKLKYNLEEARRSGYHTLLTFGGAFSNHIAATAAAGKVYGFNTIGVIRGEDSSLTNPTLSEASKNGMQLHFITREQYRQKEFPAFAEELRSKLGNFYLIPEGGSNALAVKGCKEILSYIDTGFDTICCSIGTGATLAGISCGLENHQSAIGFSSLKGGEFLQEKVAEQILMFSGNKESIGRVSINSNYHFGGYARTTAELIAFRNSFQAEHSIELDYIYTAKMMYGIMDLLREGYFKKGSTVVAVHTGGLQGNRGFESRDFVSAQSPE
ncbi:MAG: 1-aminocyclopropane-1-carboxylate deaminase/D-cysteine desulfhydrase [Bacteroidia bacterium]